IHSAEYDEAGRAEYERYLMEAQRSGNLEDDPNADWLDLESAGVADTQELETRAIQVLEMVDMADDIYKMGLLGTIDPAERADLATSILKAREALRERLTDPEYANLVETFDVERYSENATMGEN